MIDSTDVQLITKIGVHKTKRLEVYKQPFCFKTATQTLKHVSELKF